MTVSTNVPSERWNQPVGDDFGVSAEQMAAGVGKITKSLDSEKWAEYGIATRDAAGNARDANTILLDTFDMLGRVTNETDRARIGADLFGKGYANLAPLIGKTRVEYEDMLGAVEKGQVITAKEAEKAERMRKAEDALSHDDLHQKNHVASSHSPVSHNSRERTPSRGLLPHGRHGGIQR